MGHGTETRKGTNSDSSFAIREGIVVSVVDDDRP